MSTPFTVEQLIEFMNSIPTTADASQWMVELQTALGRLFPEIDRQVYLFNQLDAQHRNTRLNWANMKIVADDSSPLGFSAQSVEAMRQERVDSLIDLALEQNNLSRKDFHPPTILTYGDPAWIGSLVLMRRIENKPFSRPMLETLERLEPFLRFIVTDHNMRYHASHPADTLFYEAVLKITEQMGLTHQEMRVLMFRLLGRSYKEIGSMLNISPSTVKNHINAVHTKAGVHTQGELFARYFAPTFGLFNNLSRDPDHEE